MAKRSIPDHIKTDVCKIIDLFNRKDLRYFHCMYIPRFKGSYLFLDRDDGVDSPGPICRLKFTGNMNKWEFAIYKYSSGQYDPDEWMFPGEEYINGTVEGALKAGMEAYHV